MINTHAFLQVLIMAAITAALRYGPFAIFHQGGRASGKLAYLGKVLPHAVMAMLVVYSLKGVTLLSAPHGLPEFMACGFTAALHLWKHNTLLSILGGTGCYMLLVQLVF